MKFNDAYSQMFPGCPDAVSLQQAAEMLGLNRHTVGELIRSRRLFALKIGRTYRIPKLSVIDNLFFSVCNSLSLTFLRFALLILRRVLSFITTLSYS